MLSYMKLKKFCQKPVHLPQKCYMVVFAILRIFNFFQCAKPFKIVLYGWKSLRNYVTVNEFYIPIYKGKGRPLENVFGVKLYQLLAGRKSLGNSRLISSKSLEVEKLSIKRDMLDGVVTYFDAQMDEQALGQYVADKASAAGVNIYENNPIERVSADGTCINIAGNIIQSDICINATGPWVRNLLDASKITTRFDTEYVRIMIVTLL